MTTSERACQIWAVLAWAATNRQTLTYGLLGDLIGVPAAGLGQLLGPIQAYCLLKDLPPLTSLVVQQDSGLPGTGCDAASPTEHPKACMKVYEYDWVSHGNPKPEGLEAAVRKQGQD
ncbi:MAG: hypothetical protein ACYTEX_25500 [Planctomycetota bacterium]|jgi:hypothetical protein